MTADNILVLLILITSVILFVSEKLRVDLVAMLVLAASTSFLMPIGHQVNVLVCGPGGYKFTDYTRVGVWLNLLILLLVALFLPVIWPL